MPEPDVRVPLREFLDFRFNQIEKDLCQLQMDVKALETSKAELAGKADNQAVNRALWVSGVALMFGLIGLLLRFLGV
jgi:hypothetical protein